MDGIGNSSVMNSYSFIDKTPAKGNNFYRFRQIDLDNRSKLSDIQKLIFDTRVDFMVYPNPIKNELHIKASNNNEGYYYQIYNMSGQLVKSGKFLDGKTDLSSLIAGAYLMRINNSDSFIKIIKE